MNIKMCIYKLSVTALALTLALALSASAYAAVEVGKAAPDFTLTGSHGESITLSDLKGKTVILEWTNHECPFVVKHYSSGNMQSLQKKYTEQGIVWLTIISSAPGKQGHVSPEKANELTGSRKAKPSHVLFDPEGTVGTAYGAKTTPHMYIINPQGVLMYQGAIDSIKSTDIADIEKAENYVVAALNAIAQGKAVKENNTRPYGCSIKYKS